MLDKLFPSDIKRMDEGQSAKIAEVTCGVLFGALSRAVKWEMLPRNVAELVNCPKVERKPQKHLAPWQPQKFLALMFFASPNSPVLQKPFPRHRVGNF